jgi:hypothetical protein
MFRDEGPAAQGFKSKSFNYQERQCLFTVLGRQRSNAKGHAMCDYSLTHLKSRPAAIKDRLVVTAFSGSSTRGFRAVGDDSNVVVCLRPGTELAFDNNISVSAFIFGKKTLSSRLARFRQVDLDVPHTHHDALELADGSTVLLTRLVPGQCATVLQLPKEGAEDHSNGKAELGSELTLAPQGPVP